MTVQVRGRRTGKTISFPVVVADHEGQRYLVSMLGENANWVHNVRAAQGKAVLRRHGAQEVRLVEVAPADRAPILRRYLDAAPGARPHIPVDRDAPLEEFERIADRYPVFRIVPVAAATLPGAPTPEAARRATHGDTRAAGVRWAVAESVTMLPHARGSPASATRSPPAAARTWRRRRPRAADPRPLRPARPPRPRPRPGYKRSPCSRLS